ncbi:MAG: glycosyltransferase family 2 protein [Neisseriaceae bacterium]|nr:glycosyltransferase family 2 protein [Neisseriaceae bacterium]
MKKVSVIIPCHNHAKYVGETIDSVLNQTYQNIEIIVVNDASTDNSSEVIQKYVDKYPKIIFIDEKENIGVIEVRNKAISMAQGDYILPLDADDKIHATYIEKAVNILENNSQIGVVYAKACFFGEKEGIWELANFNKENILLYNMVFVTSLFRKEDFLHVGAYNKNMYGGYEDWDLWLSFVEHNFDFYQIDEVLFYYRIHQQSRNLDAKKKEDHLYQTIINNHRKLYADFFYDNRYKIKNIFRIEKIEYKYHKYRFLFKILLVIVILQLLIIIGLMI